jgi:hypothetical protein
MRPLTPFILALPLGLLGTALGAFYLGGDSGAGVLAGGLSGLGFGALVALAERRLFGGKNAFHGLLFAFLAKLFALLAVTVLFLVLEPRGIDPAATVLAFLAGVLLASAGAWLGALRAAAPEAAPR